MKLDPPLSDLIHRCQTVCVAECCGIAAYDFSQVHIASYLLMSKGKPDKREVETLRAQLQALKANYGTHAASKSGFTSEEMNQIFAGDDVDSLVTELAMNLDLALNASGTQDLSEIPVAERTAEA